MLNKLKIQHRITLLIVFLVIFIVTLTSVLFYYTTSKTVENQIGKRALHVATMVATMPEVKAAFKTEEPWRIIQPIAEEIRYKTQAEYVVVGNKEGIRYSHPVPQRIGKKMVGGDNDKALIHGQTYVSKATGTLGHALRGKTPIKNEAGEIIGIVSVGFLMEDIKDTAGFYGVHILWISALGLIVGILGSIYVARGMKKSMFGLEPEEIAALYEQTDAVIQSVREGILLINRQGHISMVNQTAYDILSIPKEESVIGKPILELLPNSTILEVLQTGEKQLDRPMEVRGKVIIANRLPVKAGDEVIGAVSSFRLKSEIDQMTEELSQVKRYTEALRAQTHEFNNLLYTLSGLLQLESYEEALELIQKETVDQQDIVQFIMSRLRDPWLGGILLGFYNRAKELKVQFILDRESSIEKLPNHIENSYIVSILGNLITNAFESVDKAYDKKVRLFVTDMGDEIIMEVEDSGQGIGDHNLPYIFNQGFTTKAGEKRGFGLAKVKALVDELQGSIAIEKGELGGALFIVALPKDRG